MDATLDLLRGVPIFASLPEADLERLARMAERVSLLPGEELFAEGSAGERAYVIEDGQIEIVKTSGGRNLLLAVRGRGDVIGEMSLLEAAPRLAAARGRSQSRLLAIDQAQMGQLLDSSPAAARAILRTVLERWRSTEALLRQSERMAQLGTLTAGIAHELNNPAAAVRRSAGLLGEAVERWRQAERDLGRAGLEAVPGQLQELALRLPEHLPADLDPLAGSDRAAEAEAWLEDQGWRIPGSWRRCWWSWATTRPAWKCCPAGSGRKGCRSWSPGWPPGSRRAPCWPK